MTIFCNILFTFHIYFKIWKILYMSKSFQMKWINSNLVGFYAFPGKMLKREERERERETESLSRKTISLHVVARIPCLPLAEYAAMLPTIPRRINSVTETRSRVVTPNITRATNERCYISPRRSLHSPILHTWL